MLTSAHINAIFAKCISTYHLRDELDQPLRNPYETDSVEYLIYWKCWIDTVQWHCEDLIRDPLLDPSEGMSLKGRIDQSNQDRTDIVENIDDWFFDQFKSAVLVKEARLNTESPAWALDRLSILALKIFHMEEEVNREDAGEDHQKFSQARLEVLRQQQSDLSLAFDQLLEDIGQGKREMKVYRQMKMYNDPSTNPVLYKKDNA